jgi:3-phenylpropionate/trans-cinnamate dioxygenase ferredoxin reductase subunit
VTEVPAPPARPGRVVVVGGGHAAAALVGLLRQGGHPGEIVVLGEELEHPYQRPPLSKKFADGQLEQWLRPPEFYREQDITVRLGEQVVAVDRAARTIRVSTGETLGYDTLVLATGAQPIALPVPGGDLGGVATLRTLRDARILRKWLAEERRIVIVGGGYIGLEVAAVARASGVEVTVLEREPQILARVASLRLSEIVAGQHLARGTVIRTGAGVTALAGREGSVRAAVLDDGTEIGCDAVLVGIGALPNVELARAAGLTCDGGLLVDDRARTDDPAVLAIGDVTRRPVPGVASPMRLESIPSATEQARQAAAIVLGREAPEPEVPWFWSDQFDLRLKVAGIVAPSRTVERGDPASGRFALFHHQDGRVVAVESSNAPAEFMAGRRLVESGRAIDPTRLADDAVPLKEIVAGR